VLTICFKMPMPQVTRLYNQYTYFSLFSSEILSTKHNFFYMRIEISNQLSKLNSYINDNMSI